MPRTLRRSCPSKNSWWRPNRRKRVSNSGPLLRGTEGMAKQNDRRGILLRPDARQHKKRLATFICPPEITPTWPFRYENSSKEFRYIQRLLIPPEYAHRQPVQHSRPPRRPDAHPGHQIIQNGHLQEDRLEWPNHRRSCQ